MWRRLTAGNNQSHHDWRRSRLSGNVWRHHPVKHPQRPTTIRRRLSARATGAHHDWQRPRQASNVWQRHPVIHPHRPTAFGDVCPLEQPGSITICGVRDKPATSGGAISCNIDNDRQHSSVRDNPATYGGAISPPSIALAPTTSKQTGRIYAYVVHLRWDPPVPSRPTALSRHAWQRA